MSKLEVDKITPQSGTTLTIGEAGDTTVVNGLGTLPATIGSATQVLSVNAGGTGLEYGTAATDLSNLNATNLTSGTVPDGRFPSVLPAAGAQNLTSLQPAAIVGGTFGSINAANLTNLNATALTSGTIPAARISSLPAGVGGKILQVVMGTTQSRTATTSQTFVDTNCTVNITPSASSSKIFITAHNQLFAADNPTNRVALGLKRDSTMIWVPAADTNTPPKYYSYFASDGANYTLPVAITYLDSPNTTNQITYKQAIASYSGSSVEDIGGNSGLMYTAVITAMEVSA